MRAVGLLAILTAACSFTGRDAPRDGDLLPGDADPDPADADPSAPDAAADADPAFNPSQCPGDYNRTIPGFPGSRYRYSDDAVVFLVHHADCLDDHLGWTHLVSADTVAEASGAAAFGPEFEYSYIGAVQDPEADSPGEGWYSFGGAAMPEIPWGFNSPDDGNPGEMENGEDQLILIKGDGEIYDVPGNGERFAVCECDGHGVDPTVAAFIPASL